MCVQQKIQDGQLSRSDRAVASTVGASQDDDAPAPEPAPQQRALVDMLQNLLHEKQYDAVLDRAPLLLRQSIEEGDIVGQAYAYRFMAQAYQRLQRSTEAIQAWQQVEQLGHQISDETFVVESLIEQAACLWQEDAFRHRNTIRELIQKAAQTALGARRRPLHTARLLHDASDQWQNERLELEIVETLRVTALKIYQQYRPHSPEEANSWYKLGALESYRSNLAKEYEYYLKAFTIYEQLGQPSDGYGWAAIKVGDVLSAWGDNVAAQYYFEIAVQIFQSLGDLRTAPYHALGIAARRRGDWTNAWNYFQQALQIQESANPYSVHVVANLDNLEMVATALGWKDRANELYARAVRILQSGKTPPEQRISLLNTVASMAERRGDWEMAYQLSKEALMLHQQQASEGVERATLLHNLSQIELKRLNLESAENYALKALQIYRRFSPYGFRTVWCLNTLARIALARGDRRTAIEYLRQANQIVEHIHRDIFYGEGRASFRGDYYDVHLRLALVYLHNRQDAEAAAMLDSSRARSLAEVLWRRQLTRRELPKGFQRLLEQKDSLEAEHSRVSQQLRRETRTDVRAQLQQRERQLNQELHSAAQRMRREFPDLVELLAPKPLSIREIQRSLDDGTVLLYHALVEDQLLIIAVSRTQVRGVTHAVNSKQLEAKVEAFRRLASRVDDFLPDGTLPPRSASDHRQLLQLAQQLYTELVNPMQGILRDAQRVLLCPSGVLSQLPWAALVVKTENGKPVYWMERVAIHLTPSVGVYRQARTVQPAPQGAAVTAVWQYGGRVDLARSRRSEVAMLLRRSGAGTVLTDLPNVKQEVQALRELFSKQARVAVNAQATPQEAQRNASNARVVHFACHARADNTDPLGSALLLAPAGADVGRLTASKVLLNWRLRADLVMLSACETGLGIAQRHEGVYSLGRAFLTAGSRSVGMSLWAVSDEATVELMKEFYRQYLQGQWKDEALRQAQLKLIRTPRYTDPYYWSAFVLLGDYKQG